MTPYTVVGAPSLTSAHTLEFTVKKHSLTSAVSHIPSDSASCVQVLCLCQCGRDLEELTAQGEQWVRRCWHGQWIREAS